MDFLKSLSAFFLSFLLPAEANDLIMRPSCPSSTPTIMLLEFKYVRGYSNTMLHFRRIVKPKAKTINEFYNIAVGIDPESNAKEYYQIVTKSGEKIDVANDDAIHFIGKHNPDSQELIEVEQNVENIIDYEIDKKKKGHYGGTVARIKLSTPKGPVGATYEFLNNGRTFLTTTFYSTEADIDNWVHKEKEGANRSTENDVPASFVSSPSISSIRKEAFSVKWDKKQTDRHNQFFQVSESEFNRQKAEVRKQYEGTAQWMKAPNGEPTNLTEDQWVTVRTTAFKNWFGNWEAPFIKEKLTNGEMIEIDDNGTKDVQNADYNWSKLVTDYANNKKGAQNKLIQFVRAFIPEVITGTKIGDINFSNNSIRNSLHHGHGRANAIVLPYIDKILQSAEAVGQRTLEDGRTSHVLVNAIEYKGQRFIILMVVNEDAQGKFYYDHEFTTIKKIDDLPAVIRNNTNATEPGQRHQSLVSILAEDVWNVNASKVVDENGEPLVVYHGTPYGGFEEFQKGRQSYFTPMEWYANKYQTPGASAIRVIRCSIFAVS